jgi:ubiquinone/menaquinone biosynthesis C-methylase UbiE
MHAFSKSLRYLALVSAFLLLGRQALPANADEVDRIAEVLSIAAGTKVADVGAGDGDWSLAMAERVGADGHVFATEVDAGEIRAIERKVQKSGLSNITVILGDQETSGLPDACCEAILLRMVYHHFVDPTSMLSSLRRALLPGGQLAVIDITPQSHWRTLEGVPDRGGHGIPPEELIDELARHGFELVARYDQWNRDADRYCIVFRSTPRSDS